MTDEKINKFFDYIRSVEVNELNKIDYTNKSTYLKSSELHKRIEDMRIYIFAVIETNKELSFKLSKEAFKRTSIENELSVCRNELNAAKGMILTLNKNE